MNATKYSLCAGHWRVAIVAFFQNGKRRSSRSDVIHARRLFTLTIVFIVAQIELMPMNALIDKAFDRVEGERQNDLPAPTAISRPLWS